MRYVNVNYPTYKIEVHENSNCTHVIKMLEDKTRRLVRINADTISSEIDNFRKNEYTLGSSAGINGVWLEIDFKNTEFEEAVQRYIITLILEHHPNYSGFSTVTDSCL
jgi:hypothetical protein